jgi:hypothetical protein
MAILPPTDLAQLRCSGRFHSLPRLRKWRAFIAPLRNDPFVAENQGNL